MISNKIKKLVLGTAQFGNHYGVTNKEGEIKSSEIEKILEFCINVGITRIDTAANYGKAEKALGKHDLNRFEVTTKLPKIPDGCQDVNGWIEDQVSNSAEKLNLSKLHFLLLHQPMQLLSKNVD